MPNNSKILFTHSYFMRFDPKQWRWNKPYPPLGTILAASVLRKAGSEVGLFDTMFSSDPMEIVPKLVEDLPDILVIYDDGFNYLTKMCLTNMREAAWVMAHQAKLQGCKVIACSSDATDHYAKYLEHGVDYVILGEGEQTLLELTTAIKENGDTSAIPGLAYFKNDQVIRTAPRPLMKQLDDLPLPAWDLISFAPYKERWLTHWGYFSINIATTRGCPYKCNWCAKPIYGDSYKMRSPGHVMEEIRWLKELTQFDHIWFCDDIFGLKRSWVIEFAELVAASGLDFAYKIQSRADLLVLDQYVAALAASGCEEAWMGVESGAQEILDAMDKGITLEQIRRANALMREHGINACFFIQFGYLGETAAQIRKTIRLINELLPFDIGISVSYPLPGTRFFEMVRQDLSGKANWTDSDDLDLMFSNTYSPAFYKILHRYVHYQFRMHKAMHQLGQLVRRPVEWSPRAVKRALSVLYYAPASFWTKQRLKAIHHEAASL